MNKLEEFISASILCVHEIFIAPTIYETSVCRYMSQNDSLKMIIFARKFTFHNFSLGIINSPCQSITLWLYQNWAITALAAIFPQKP